MISAIVIGGVGTVMIGGVVYLILDDKKINKKQWEKKMKLREETKQNKRLNNFEEELMEYPYYDKVNKKLENLSEEVDELQELFDQRKIKDEEYIKNMNMKIEVVLQAIAKFSELESEKERAIKPIVLDMIKKITKEVREKRNNMTNEDIENEKKKFKEKAELLEKM